MSSRDNLLNENKNCSFEENDVENVCCENENSACRVRRPFTALEQHPADNSYVGR